MKHYLSAIIAILFAIFAQGCASSHEHVTKNSDGTYTATATDDFSATGLRTRAMDMASDVAEKEDLDYAIIEERDVSPFSYFAYQIKFGLTSRPEIMVYSYPTSAKVEINDDLVGVTPLSFPIKRTHWGKLATGYRIAVYPNEHGQFVQRKVLLQGADIPKNLYFDLRLKPVSPFYPPY